MNIIYCGKCPGCGQTMIRQETYQVTFEACFNCGFAHGRGAGIDPTAEPERFSDQWFNVWAYLFKTYGVTSRQELREKLQAAGLKLDHAAYTRRNTIFDYKLGHIAHVLAAIQCYGRHKVPCRYCERFRHHPLARHILTDLSNSRQL